MCQFFATFLHFECWWEFNNFCHFPGKIKLACETLHFHKGVPWISNLGKPMFSALAGLTDKVGKNVFSGENSAFPYILIYAWYPLTSAKSKTVDRDFRQVILVQLWEVKTFSKTSNPPKVLWSNHWLPAKLEKKNIFVNISIDEEFSLVKVLWQYQTSLSHRTMFTIWRLINRIAIQN